MQTFNIFMLVLGLFVALFGAFLVANAAFEDRAQLGFGVAVVGIFFVLTAATELYFQT